MAGKATEVIDAGVDLDLAVQYVCSFCGQKLIEVPAPKGHENHRHMRCSLCSELFGMQSDWAMCVHPPRVTEVDGDPVGGDA